MRMGRGVQQAVGCSRQTVLSCQPASFEVPTLAPAVPTRLFPSLLVHLGGNGCFGALFCPPTCSCLRLRLRHSLLAGIL